MPREISFIEYVCRHIETYDLNQCNLHVVLPSMRLKRELELRLSRRAEAQGRIPCWLPQFTTISQLIGELSGLRPAHPTELTAWLYRAYQAAYSDEGKPPKTFDQFWEWGQMLISDFNQIDNQLAPAQDILEYTAEEKRIAGWHLDIGSSTGELQNKYLQFYARLWPIYCRFRQDLLEHGCAYTGLAALKAAERWEKDPSLKDGNSRHFYLFAGLNALTAAEKKLIRSMVRARKAEILWNADCYYMEEDSWQEAGHFLRQYRKDSELNHFLKEEDLCDRIRHIRFRSIPCTQNTGQAKMLMSLLGDRSDAARTLIVLNDESLLSAVMNSLSPDLRCNVSIAGSLSGTLSCGFFNSLLQARDAIRLQARKGLPVAELLGLFRNPLFGRLAKKDEERKKKRKIASVLAFDPENDRFDSLLERLSDCPQCYFSAWKFRQLLPHDNEAADLCTEFLFPESRPAAESGSDADAACPLSHAKDSGPTPALPATLFDKVDRLCELLLASDTGLVSRQTRLFGSDDPLINAYEREFLECLSSECKKQQSLLQQFSELAFGEISLQKMLQQSLSQIGIHYVGDPENSLNIMGMLETRGMEFDHVILLSMNEGMLPAIPSDESFLLYSVKEHYGLPTPREQIAMQAHHFYSLLQDCRRATLLYVRSQTDQSKEKSRFLLQLENELPEARLNEEHPYPFRLYHPRYDRHDELSIRKTPFLLEQLRNALQRKTSYSSLSSYLTCPMRFYRERILDWGEPPETGKDMDVAVKGSIFHKALENFFCGKGPDRISRLNIVLNESDVTRFRQQQQTLLEQAAEEVFPDGDISQGANFIAAQEIRLWMERYARAMEAEIGNGELRILRCEENMQMPVAGLLPEGNILLEGFADRIDIYRRQGEESVLRIIDYKTGLLKKLQLDDWNMLKEPEGAQALQLLMYLYLYHSLHPETPYRLQACICSTRNKAEMSALHGKKIDELPIGQIVEGTQRFLSDTIAEILDPQQDIVCRRDPARCTYCPYIEFCGPGTPEEPEARP